MMYRNLL